MIDVAISLLTELIPVVPTLIVIILVFNLISNLLWGGK